MIAHTIIIWQLIPENIEIYVVPNTVLTEEMHQLLAEAHGSIIGAVDYEKNNGLMFLNMALLENTVEHLEENKSEKYIKHLGLLAPYRRYNQDGNADANVLQKVIEESAGEGLLVSNIICTGFFL